MSHPPLYIFFFIFLASIARECAVPFRNKSDQFGRNRFAFEERTRYRISYYSTGILLLSIFPPIDARIHTYIDTLHMCAPFVKLVWQHILYTPRIALRSMERNPSLDRKLLSDHAYLPLLCYRFRSRESSSSLWVNDRVRNPARCNISFMCKRVKVESLSCLAGIRITCIRKNNVIFHEYKQRS